ncbi:DUF6965 family protein [Flavobacterium ginsenosidimutans]|uniref:DUF6965 family protein n=1 Tax=Flavobacterium ginsenosidimutans TaxID=687844 RepID=UPI00194F4B8E|nr:hypothetical protein [Flavobacterium ginsenosidimutans]
MFSKEKTEKKKARAKRRLKDAECYKSRRAGEVKRSQLCACSIRLALSWLPFLAVSNENSISPFFLFMEKLKSSHTLNSNSASQSDKEADWKPWAKITDSQFFLNSCYTGTRNFNGKIERCPAWRHLKDFTFLSRKHRPSRSARNLLHNNFNHSVNS